MQTPTLYVIFFRSFGAYLEIPQRFSALEMDGKPLRICSERNPSSSDHRTTTSYRSLVGDIALVRHGRKQLRSWMGGLGERCDGMLILSPLNSAQIPYRASLGAVGSSPEVVTQFAVVAGVGHYHWKTCHGD